MANSNSDESDGAMLERLGSDAAKWADEFITRFGEHKDKIDNDLMLAWFANAMCAATDRQTFVQAVGHAEGRAHTQRAISFNDSGLREFSLAIMKLEEAQMWFTRGMAIKQGIFNPADLEERT